MNDEQIAKVVTTVADIIVEGTNDDPDEPWYKCKHVVQLEALELAHEYLKTELTKLVRDTKE